MTRKEIISKLNTLLNEMRKIEEKYGGSISDIPVLEHMITCCNLNDNINDIRGAIFSHSGIDLEKAYSYAYQAGIY